MTREDGDAQLDHVGAETRLREALRWTSRSEVTMSDSDPVA
jgi:hypothetical protein